eukprot:2897095-Rhodomonas_salina.4
MRSTGKEVDELCERLKAAGQLPHRPTHTLRNARTHEAKLPLRDNMSSTHVACMPNVGAPK